MEGVPTLVLPIIHGTGGEDGALQGLLELAGLPYVGARVLGSAVQMDKDVAKRLLAAAGLPVVPWRVLGGAALAGPERDARSLALARELGFPVFVKPANSGSSVGIAKAGDPAELASAVADAARYDRKILLETAVVGREIEVAVLGNDDPKASVPGEIRIDKDYYDYEAKYADEATELVIPAVLDEATSERLRSLAVEAFQVLEGAGFARVDFFVEDETGNVYVNELNSLPGFTEGSMFPLMWEASGLSYPSLLSRLIDLALERHAQRSKLETTYRRG